MGIVNYKVYTPLKYSNIVTHVALKEYFLGEYSEEKLNNLKVADLSCGTGNLLCVILEKLIKLSKKVKGHYEYNKNWIYAYDIDEKALIQYKENVIEILKKYSLEKDIEINTFLMDSITQKIEKKFDIILGNPPYIGEKNNKELFAEVKKTDFGLKYYEAKMDYFYFFIEKAIELLEENGNLSYITTNYWLKADSGKILRNTFKENGNFKYINNFNTSVFIDAPGQHNIIFSWKKEDKSLDRKFYIQVENQKFKEINKNIYDENDKIILLSEEEKKFSKTLLEKSNLFLGDILNINQGIVSGCDKAFVFDKYDDKFSEYLKPFYKNKDIYKYSHEEQAKFWIIYFDKYSDISEELKNYLSKFREPLEKRREAKEKKIRWYDLHWGRKENIFLEEKIIARQRCKTNYFAYSNKDFYGSADIYYLTKKREDISLLYVLGYLNSKIFYNWYKLNGKSKGYNLEFYSTPLKESPIYYPASSEEIIYIENLVKKQILSYSDEVQKQIEEFFHNYFFI